MKAFVEHRCWRPEWCQWSIWDVYDGFYTEIVTNIMILWRIENPLAKSLNFWELVGIFLKKPWEWIGIRLGYIDACDGYWKRNVLLATLRCEWPIQYIEKVTNILKTVTNIMFLSPTSNNCHRDKVTYIKLSPTWL